MTLIAIHMIQNHAPSNLNRDDNGDPKDCLFGGSRRARISSQALKRSIRQSEVFKSYFTEQPEVLAVRTQLLPKEVKGRLEGRELSDEAVIAIVEAATKFGKADKGAATTTTDEGSEDTTDKGKGKKGKKEKPTTPSESVPKTKQLMFLTAAEIDRLTDELVEMYQEKGVDVFNTVKWDAFREKKAEQYVPHSVDIAMFGRMTTSSPFKNVEAAVQVAHALSTHTVTQEFDFYTAVDDISGETGAGFLGETAFNSATYYKYANIHWEGLCENLQGDTVLATHAVQALTKAMMTAIPSGKQNSFAAHNLPDLVLVEVRPDNIPLSYANAFAKPVRATAQQSLTEASTKALEDYIPQINNMYGLETQRVFMGTVGLKLNGAEDAVTMDRLLEQLVKWLPVGA